LRKSKRDSNDDWQVIDLSDRTNSVSPLITKDLKTDGESEVDVIKKNILHEYNKDEKIHNRLRKIRKR